MLEIIQVTTNQQEAACAPDSPGCSPCGPDTCPACGPSNCAP